MTSTSFSLVKYAKAEILANEAIQSLRYLQRAAAHQDSQQVSGGCGPVTDPILLELMQHACKEAALSQIDKEQILDAIVAPREWEEEGKHYRQLISKDSTVRADVIQLNDLLNQQLTMRQARPDGLCPIRRDLADECFDELIRQVTISQAERGLLLLRIRDELRMTLSAYQVLFVSARDYDSRNTVAKETMILKSDFTARLTKISNYTNTLETKKEELQSQFDQSEQIFREEREAAHKSHNEDFQFLKRVNNALKQQIDAMMDPENNIDPVIEAYEGVKGKHTRIVTRRNPLCDDVKR